MGKLDLGWWRVCRQPRIGNPAAIDGKYMTVWTKQQDGTWKIAVDMFNVDGITQ